MRWRSLTDRIPAALSIVRKVVEKLLTPLRGSLYSVTRLAMDATARSTDHDDDDIPLDP